MKKIFLLISVVLLFATGCGKVTKEDVINKLEKKVNSGSYVLKGTMQILSNEEKFDYGITVNSHDKKYYKVALVNQTNNHEQVILKNDDGVYVVTPALNKSFKFQSEWPNNSSQAYILESIIKDLKSDTNSKFEETKDGYELRSTVNYPNNSDLSYQKVIVDNDLNIKEIEVYDINDSVKISVIVDNLNYKAKLDKNDFLLEDLIVEDVCENESCDNKNTNLEENNKNDTTEEEIINNNDNNIKDNENNLNENKETSESSNVIDDIIYPLYVPSNTYLTSSEKIDLEDGNRVILTFSGDKDFVLVEETSKVSNEFEIIPIYGDPQVISTSVAAVGANSIYFTIDNIDYYIASSEMSSEEMLNVASSLGNSILVMESK